MVDDSPLNRKINRRLLESAGKKPIEFGLLYFLLSLAAFMDFLRLCFSGGELLNCLVVEADDGVTALSAMRNSSKPFDCVFLDSVMTEMHGPETAKQMRTELGYTNPIISVTGNTLPEDVGLLLTCGVDIVLTKPVAKSKLLESMKKLNVIS